MSWDIWNLTSDFLSIKGTFAVKSKYVCQGQRLRLRCEGDYIIRILGAKYGRLEPGSSICPHENITDMDCRAPDALLKMTVRCGNKHKCTVKADHTMFGDPCPGTFKYLDVIYRCSKFILIASFLLILSLFKLSCQKAGFSRTFFNQQSFGWKCSFGYSMTATN